MKASDLNLKALIYEPGMLVPVVSVIKWTIVDKKNGHSFKLETVK